MQLDIEHVGVFGDDVKRVDPLVLHSVHRVLVAQLGGRRVEQRFIGVGAGIDEDEPCLLKRQMVRRVHLCKIGDGGRTRCRL